MNRGFFDIVDQKGGLLDPDQLDSPQEKEFARFVLHIMKSTVDGINAKNILYPLGEIDLAIVSNLEMNAFAYHRNNKEGIAVFWGLAVRLAVRATQLLKYLASGGNIEDRRSAEEIATKLLSRRKVEFWSGLFGPKFDSDVLAERTHNLLVASIMYVVLHEIGHLVNAHVPTIQSEFDETCLALFEIPSGETFSRLDIIQAMETDADRHATQTIFDLAMTTWHMNRIFPVNYAYPRGDTFSYLVDIFRALALVHFCMDEFREDENLQSSRSHPTPGMRAGMAAFDALNLLNHPFKIGQETALAANIVAQIEVGSFFTRELGAKSPTMSYDPGVLIRSGIDRRIEAEKIIRIKKPYLDRRLRFHGRNPADFDDVDGFYDLANDPFELEGTDD